MKYNIMFIIFAISLLVIPSAFASGVYVGGNTKDLSHQSFNVTIETGDTGLYHGTWSNISSASPKWKWNISKSPSKLGNGALTIYTTNAGVSMQMSDNVLNDVMTNGTMTLWIRFKSTQPSAAGARTFMWANQGGQDQYWLTGSTLNTFIPCFVYSGTTTTPCKATAINIATNTWYMLTWTWVKSSQVDFYMNKTRLYQFNITAGNKKASTHKFSDGRLGGTLTRYGGNVSFDEFRLINTSVTLTNISQLYNHTFGSQNPFPLINGTGTSGDTTPPSVYDVRPKSNTNYVMNQKINISANVTDNVAVSTVRANVTKPAGLGTVTLTLKLSSTIPKYNNTFRLPNQTGRYNVTFLANDTSNNKNWTVKTYFMIPTNVMITAISPPNNTQYKTIPTFRANISTNALTNINCTLKINNVVNQTKTVLSPTNVSYSPSLSAIGPYNFTIQCKLLSTGYQANSSQNTIFYDNILPTIQTNLLNQSIYYKLGSNITFRTNFSDTYLFSYNITVNGVQYYGATNLVGTTTRRQINFTLSPSSFKASSTNNITQRVADGHTSQKLVDNYTFDSSQNKLSLRVTQHGEHPNIPLLSRDSDVGSVINYIIPIEYMLGQESNLQHISIESINDNGKFNINKDIDRYTFEYESNSKKNTYKFLVTSDEQLYIINLPNSPYKSWLVTGDKWIDFLLENEPNEIVDIKQITDKSVEVTIRGVQNSVLRFKSIGELNIVSKTYSFFVYANNAPQYSTSLNEITIPTLKLTVNKSTQLTTSMILTYNHTKYLVPNIGKTTSYLGENWSNLLVVTPFVQKRQTINNSWNYTLSSDTTSVTRVVTFNQKVVELNLTNCTQGTQTKKPGINFSVSDADTGQLIGNLRMNGIFSLWTDPTLAPGGRNIYKNISIVSSTNLTSNKFYLCTNTNKSIYMGWTMNYFTINSGYNLGLSVVTVSDTANITNRTSIVYPLTLISSTSSAIINVIDNFGTDLVGYFVKMWLIRPGLNDTLSTTFVTDFQGNWQVQFNPIKNYRFDIYNPSHSTLIYSTGTTSITSNPFVIQIPNSENDLLSLQALTTMGSNVSCNRITKTCQFTWNNPIIKTAYFNVFRVNGWGSTLIYNNSQTATFGTMSYTVVDNLTINTYHAVGSIQTNTNNSFYVIGQADLLNNAGIFRSLGDVSTVIFMALFVVWTLALLLIDIGPLGIMIGIIVGLIAGTLVGVVPLTTAGLIAIISVLIIGLWFGRG